MNNPLMRNLQDRFSDGVDQQALQELLRHPNSIRDIVNNPSFQSIINSSTFQDIMSSPSMQNLVNNPAMQNLINNSDFSNILNNETLLNSINNNGGIGANINSIMQNIGGNNNSSSSNHTTTDSKKDEVNQEAINAIKLMGFTDEERIKQALIESDGDIARAIEKL